MAPKRKSASNSRDSEADDVDDTEFGLSVTVAAGRLRTSKRLKTSASTSEDARADDTDDEHFAHSITRGLTPPHRSKRSPESSLTSPVAVSLPGHTPDKKPEERYKQETLRLLDLPLDVLCLVADRLDVVARACLRYAQYVHF